MTSKFFFYFLLLCLTIGSTNAQERKESTDSTYYGKHEIKLNAILLVVGAFEVNYEYLLNEEMGLGISAFAAYDDSVIEDIDYYISPYFRYYFGKKYASGFFVEGFGMLNRTDRNVNLIFLESEDSNFVTDFALGFGLGSKWVTKRGWMFEFNYGIGRNLFNNKESDLDLIGKFGISLGYRF